MRSACWPPPVFCPRAALPMSPTSAASSATIWPGGSSRSARRHLRRLQGRRLPDHRQRQGALGRGPAAGLDLQDSELDHRAGDRRGRGSRQGRLQVGRGDAQHRGLEQGSHLALGDRGVRRAGLSGDRAAHRARAHAEICRPVRLRQPRHRRRHRPVLADRQPAHRSRFSRSISSTGCAAACCRFPSAARN